MSRLTRDGTAEPVSRDQILTRERDRKIFLFPVQLTTSRIGTRTRLIHTLAVCVTIHTCVPTVTRSYLTIVCVLLCCLFSFNMITSLFPSIFCTVAIFSLYAECHQIRRRRRATRSSTSQGRADPLYATIKGLNREVSEGKADL